MHDPRVSCPSFESSVPRGHNLAARIQAAAAPGEVRVSSTVKDLDAGAGHGFASRGEQQLTGVEEPWRPWAVG